MHLSPVSPPPHPTPQTHRCVQEVGVTVDDGVPVEGVLQRREFVNHIQHEVHSGRELGCGGARVAAAWWCHKCHDYAGVAGGCGHTVQQHVHLREVVPVGVVFVVVVAGVVVQQQQQQGVGGGGGGGAAAGWWWWWQCKHQQQGVVVKQGLGA